MQRIEIRPVVSAGELRRFAALGNRLYKGCPQYVPDLEGDVRRMFSPASNAAYEFSEAQPFLAYRDGEAVGRVAAIINHRANETWGVKNVRFSYLDFPDDPAVSAALIEAVEQWGRNRGMTACQGPMGFTDFDKEGMLVEGFDRLGTLTAYYNHAYCPRHLEALGYEKEADWVQLRVSVPKDIPARFVRVSELVTRRYGLRVVKPTGRTIFSEGYGRKIFDLLNEAYAPLFGFSRLSERQVDEIVKQYFGLMDMRLVTLILTPDDELVGIAATMGSLSRALQKSGGRLLPFGWWPLLRSLRFKPEDTVEMILIAVKPTWQGRGVNALLFSDLIPIYNRYGFRWAETAPQLELNHKELNQWDVFDPEVSKRRRCYCKSLV